MITFDQRTGPDLGADAPRYPSREVPRWFRDAKFGCFIHFGLYSVPGWATTTPPSAGQNPYAHHQYAEWYGNTVRIAQSPTWRRHQQVFGTGRSYEDLADLWQPEAFDARWLVGELTGAGARYIIPTTKHHDGFCLWDTATTGFNSARRGPRRDLIAELHTATRQAGARFGVYFSGALDWHVSDFPPIESDVDLFRYRRQDELFARYAAAQLEELIGRFSPDVLWNDIDWPDGGKGRQEYAVAALVHRYLQVVPDGVVNDRWGVPFHDFATREYLDVDELQTGLWESTRGLGRSFGYNQAEDASHCLSGSALIRHLVDVVSKNGNLLLNVGPRADGSVPELQLAALRELGTWLRINGDAIFGTRPWLRCGEPTGAPRAYTAADGLVYVHLLDPATGHLQLPPELARPEEAFWLAGRSPAEVTADGIAVPQALRGDPVAVLCVRPRGTAGHRPS